MTVTIIARFLSIIMVCSIGIVIEVIAQNQTVIKNVRVFDGVSEELIGPTDILIEDNLIVSISPNQKQRKNVPEIDGREKILIPGLSDAHTHIMWTDKIQYLVYGAPEGYSGVRGGVAAREMLLRGFTTIRDLGGPSVGLKEVIDSGITPGPRILPSGAFVSQTSGHGDYDPDLWYLSHHYTGQIDKAYLRGWTVIADGVSEVQKATRDILRAGVSQIKVFGSGSITGAHDPLDVTEYTYDELVAISEEARKWGTYATIHAYSDEGIQNAIKAGFKCVEHGLFASVETFKMMKDNDVFFSTQFLAFSLTPEEAGMEGPSVQKYLIAQAGAQAGYEAAKKAGVKMAWGTDALGSLEIQQMQSQEFVARSKYFSGYEILKQATSLNAELFERSGNRHPYQEGPLGVIKEGAYADLLIVEGNPLEDITLLADPETNILLIMKDGVVYKNNLEN